MKTRLQSDVITWVGRNSLCRGEYSTSLGRSSAGFTLVELMISIVLGLLLVAAASQLFIAGVVGARLQSAGADLQNNGLFGLDFMAKDIRLANSGNTNYLQITDSTPMGGVVLSVDSSTSNNSNLPLVRTTYSASSYVPIGLITSGSGDTVSGTTNQWQGLSNVTSGGAALASDQLTIDYIAPATMVNCAGNTVNAGDYVIERYFLRYDTVGAATTSGIKNLVLACDAGSVIAGLSYLTTTTAPPVGSLAASSANAPITPSVVCGTFTTPAVYSATNPTTVTTIANPSAGCATAFGGAGQVLMGRVDHLHFLLGTIAQDGSGNMTYYTINQYKGLTSSPKPQIVSIQVAVLVRSLDNTGNAAINTGQNYTMFDQTVTPVAGTGGAGANRYFRQVYETTVALRNAMGSAS